MGKDLIDELKKSHYTVALTGAGVSTGSGIPDFRSSNGVYSKYPEYVFDIDHFYTDPSDFYRFWKEAFSLMIQAKPNNVHLLLAELERIGLLKVVITQNIDGLHQKAGSKNVIELHGNINEHYCSRCKKKYETEKMKELLEKNHIPYCDCGGLIRPNIVFFGENLPSEALKEAIEHAKSCNIMIVLGSSLIVYPAAQLPIIAKDHNAMLIIVNRGKTGLDDLADLKLDVDLVGFANDLLGQLQSA
ncbi:NAD-dependent protein deacylase [Pseudothermotoga sp.]|uniref:NAD-dependent protein deacylase n=1 Tax=Pseudothermotoga sp. TaxID=2033661 RepID=UPI0031F68BE6